jgi:hypothetical protein
MTTQRRIQEILFNMSIHSAKYQGYKKLGVEDFEKIFTPISDFVKKIEQSKKKHCAIIAKVKSGKRLVKELLSLRSSPDKTHIYLSAWNRRDEQSQLKELTNYGIMVRVIKEQGDMINVVNDVSAILKDNRSATIHFNESDFGTGSQQLISDGFNKIVDRDGVKFIFYSATNEELLFSKKAADCEILKFAPPSSYRGDEWFLDNNLITESTPFWDFELNAMTPQGIEACKLLQNSEEKLFGIVRFSKGIDHVRNNQAFADAIQKDFNFKLIFVSQKESFDWGPHGDFTKTAHEWLGNPNLKALIVICQTCSRSTEVGFHKLIAFWHDHREKSTSFNTASQAAQRVNHYFDGISENYIRVYSSLAVWQLSAERITPEEFYSRTNSNLSDRIKTAKKRSNYVRYVFDHEPTDAEIIQKAEETGIVLDVHNKLKNENRIKKKVLYCKTNNVTDVALAAVNGSTRSTIGKNQVSIYVLDGPSPFHQESWEKALEIKLENKWVLILPSKKSKTIKFHNVDPLIQTKNGKNGSIYSP